MSMPRISAPRVPKGAASPSASPQASYSSIPRVPVVSASNARGPKGANNGNSDDMPPDSSYRSRASPPSASSPPQSPRVNRIPAASVGGGSSSTSRPAMGASNSNSTIRVQTASTSRLNQKPSESDFEPAFEAVDDRNIKPKLGSAPSSPRLLPVKNNSPLMRPLLNSTSSTALLFDPSELEPYYPTLPAYSWAIATFVFLGLGFLGTILLKDASEAPSQFPLLAWDNQLKIVRQLVNANGQPMNYTGLLNGTNFFGIVLIMFVFPLGFLSCGGLSSHLLLNHVGTRFFPSANSLASKLFRKGRRQHKGMDITELDSMSTTTSRSSSPTNSLSKSNTMRSSISMEAAAAAGGEDNIQSVEEDAAMVEYCCSPTIRRSTRMTLALMLGIGSLLIVLLAWYRFIRAFTNQFGLGAANANGLQLVWGAILQTVGFAFAIIFFTQAYRHYQVGESEKTGNYEAVANAPANPDQLVSSSNIEAVLMRPPHPNRYVDNASYIMTLFIGLGLALLGCMFGSDIWTSNYLVYSATTDITNILGTQTLPKLYADVAVYYAGLFVVTIAGTWAHFSPSLQHFLHRRSRFYVLGVFPHGLTNGEMLMFLVLGSVFAFWATYWPGVLNPAWVRQLQLNDPYIYVRVGARTTGHLSVLTMGLLLYPAARNSLWEAAFGVPFDRAIAFHRKIAIFSYGMATLHMLFWFIKWSLEDLDGRTRADILMTNIFSITGLQVAPGPQNIHWSNWTVVMAEIAWVFMTIIVFVAIFARRSSYELFLYTHNFAIGTYIAVITHAVQSWYFMFPALMFWMLDKGLRLYRTRAVTAVSVEAGCGGIIRLVMSSNAVGRQSHYAGQWSWICIPALSSTEWHPFSISSAPGSKFLTFHIKSMGDGTFTQSLENFALQQSATKNPHAIEILIDGPYGRFPYYSDDADVLILLAGGIGITPMISAYQDLHNRARADSAPIEVKLESSAAGGGVAYPNRFGFTLQHAILLWTVKTEDEICPFADAIQEINDNNVGSVFETLIHVTRHSDKGEKAELPARITNEAKRLGRAVPTHVLHSDRYPLFSGLQPAQVPFYAGRPNMREIFQSIRDRNSRNARIMLLSCGPETLIREASELCFDYDINFHSETFEY